MSKGHFCWNELRTPDVTKAKEFYQSLFGWQYQEQEVPYGHYSMIHSQEHNGGLIQIPANKQGEIPPHWLSYVSVEDIDTATAKATSLGATITAPKTVVGDFGCFVIIQDPTGAKLGLWQSYK